MNLFGYLNLCLPTQNNIPDFNTRLAGRDCDNFISDSVEGVIVAEDRGVGNLHKALNFRV